MASVAARAYNGGVRTEPLVRGRSPLKLKSFLLLDVHWKRQICPYSPCIADSDNLSSRWIVHFQQASMSQQFCVLPGLKVCRYCVLALLRKAWDSTGTSVTAESMPVPYAPALVKIAATRCHILQLKCTKFDFGGGSAPYPAGGAYSAPPDPLAGFRGAYC